MDRLPTLRCPRDKQPAAGKIYDYFVREELASQLDKGYRVIDYQDTKNPKGKPVGAGDGKVECEELWENSFVILDELGQKKDSVQKYQALRKLIETDTRRPIPWILEAPTVGVASQKQQGAVETSAQRIRQKVGEAIKKLNQLLDKAKLDTTKCQRCLIACLYWFCWVDGKRDKKEIKIPGDVKKFLVDEGLEEIAREFGEYLSQKGGLGLSKIGKDAPIERTAFETVRAKIKRGRCTEQAKVLYAVLRMAGVEAHFVEPKLPLEYYQTLSEPVEPPIPLPAHVATGVQVEITDQNGKPKVWILDMALKMFQADYVEKGYPYWELSLRHMFTMHLSNLGGDQTERGEYQKAGENFKLALDFGHDSTAYLIMGNYFYLLRKNPPLKPNEEYEQKMMYGKGAIEIRPDSAVFQLNWALYLAKKREWEMSLDAFLKSIDSDPRDNEVYRKFGLMLYNMRKYALNKFPKTWDMFKEQIQKVVEKYPFYQNRVREGLKVMRVAVGSKRLSDEQLIEFIKQLEKDLGFNELQKNKDIR